MSIRLSPKHGVNPSVGLCFFCGEEDGTVVLPGQLRGDAEAPRRAVWSMEPCEKCAAHMQLGILLIQVRDEEPTNNPFRTGPVCVIKADAIERLLAPGPARDNVLERRWSFMPVSVWQQLGLPEGDTPPSGDGV